MGALIGRTGGTLLSLRQWDILLKRAGFAVQTATNCGRWSPKPLSAMGSNSLPGCSRRDKFTTADPAHETLNLLETGREKERLYSCPEFRLRSY